MKVLFIGDVFGKPGRRAITQYLPEMIQRDQLDFVIANGENMAGGKGMTPDTCTELFEAGVNVITGGNHSRDQLEIDPMLQTDARLLRPFNYPDTMPGRGQTILSAGNGVAVAVINAIGKVHFKDGTSPFESIKKLVTEARQSTPIVIVDFHAEATSEKRAMGWFLDGQVSAVLGSHTHVQTADEEILPNGTAYLTDAGMTGPYDSVIGLRKDLAFERFVEGKKGKFDIGRGDVRLCAARVEIDPASGKATKIDRVQLRVDV